MTKLAFSKYSGCGNDFVLFDNRRKLFRPEYFPIIPSLCHRNLGIGADGVILLEHSDLCAFRMRIFNADGSEAEMCGNGLRCFGRFLTDQGVSQDTFTVEVGGKAYTLEIKAGSVSASMPPPAEVQWDLNLKTERQSYRYDFLDTGVPHAVIFVDDLDKVDLEGEGPFIRHHSLFAPRGTNVDFAMKSPCGGIKVRTYERGVEGETLACGTGCAAAALSAAKKFRLPSPVTVLPKSDAPLKIYFSTSAHGFSELRMEGPADFIFQGEIEMGRWLGQTAFYQPSLAHAKL